MSDDPAVVTAYHHVVTFALEHDWAATPQACTQIAQLVAQWSVGQRADAPTIAAAVARRKNDTPTFNQGVAVIPIYGVIAPRMNLMSEMSGGTTFEMLTGQLHEALAQKPQAIVFDVDSPGGNVAGATEFAREVLKARTQVPVIAQANHLMASAAYWVGSCATEIVASPSAMVGGIGVYNIHNDISKALEQMGIKRDVISAGKYKGEGVDGGPLTEEARAHRQDLVDTTYGRFIGDVAIGRGVSTDTVRSKYGHGRVLHADAALDAGMITRIGTIADTLSRFILPTTTAVAVTPQEPTRFTGQDHAAFVRQQLELARLGAHCAIGDFAS